MLLQAQLENSTAMADMAKDGPDHNGNAAKTAAAASTAASMASMAQAIYAMPGAPGGGAGGYAPFQSLMGALSNLPPAMANAAVAAALNLSQMQQNTGGGVAPPSAVSPGSDRGVNGLQSPASTATGSAASSEGATSSGGRQELFKNNNTAASDDGEDNTSPDTPPSSLPGKTQTLCYKRGQAFIT